MNAKIITFPLRIDQWAEHEPPLPPAPQDADLDLPNALDLYPDHAELISKLRRVGVPRIFGIFDHESWAVTTREAELYRLPLHGRARADLSEVTRLLESEMGGSPLYTLGFVSRRGQVRRALPGLVRRLEASGELPAMLFPKFAEPEWGGVQVQVAYPAIPQDMWRLTHQARLIGGRLEVAAPGNAIQFVNLGEGLAASLQREVSRMTNLDPILTMRTGDSVVVLGRYGEAETIAMATLVAVLEGMAAKL